MVSFSCDSLKSDISLRYEVLMEMAPFGFVLIDLSGTIVEINKQAVSILGFISEEEAKHINTLSYASLENSGISKLIRDAIGCNAPITKTLIFNESCTVKCTACSIYDTKKSVCFVVFLIEDVSQLEMLKDKYFRIARTLASVVDSIESHYIWAKDEAGRYQMVSKSYSSLFNMSPKEMMNLTDYDLFDEDMADSYTDDDKEVLTSCGLKEISEVVTTPLMGARIWRTMKNAICDEEGNGVISVGIAEDITDEHTRRESAKKAIVELEAFVRRTQPNDL